jgi:hypothetical protein
MINCKNSYSFQKLSHIWDNIAFVDKFNVRKNISKYITASGNHIVNEYSCNIIIKYATRMNASNSGHIAIFDKRLLKILETYDKRLNPFLKNL